MSEEMFTEIEAADQEVGNITTEMTLILSETRKSKNSGHIVVQSNDVMSKLRNNTSAAESKVLYYIASKLPKKAMDEGNLQMPVIILDLRELCCAAEWDPTSRQRIKDMRTLLWSLKDGRKATFTLRSESGWDMPLPWIEQIAFGYRAPKVALLLNRKLAPFYLRLTSNFTCFDVAMTSKLTSRKTLSLYEIIKANQFKGEAIINIEKFKAANDIKGSGYTYFSQFQRRILDPAITEINDHTDVTVAYKKENAGRKTELIKVDIESKDPEEIGEYVAEWSERIKEYIMSPEEEEAEREKVEQMFFGTAAPIGDGWEYGLHAED